MTEIKTIPPPVEITVRLLERGMRPIACSLEGEKKLLQEPGDSVKTWTTKNTVTVGLKPVPGIFWREYTFKTTPERKVAFTCGLSQIEVVFEEFESFEEVMM